MRKRFLSLMVLVALLLTACHWVEPVEPEEGAAAAEAATPAAAEEAAGGLQVTDALGNPVEFAAAPERIVAAGRDADQVTAALFMFSEAITRVVAYAAGPVNDPAAFLPLIDPGFAAKTVLEPDAWAAPIVDVNPDAVILKTTTQAELGEALVALDVPVVYVGMESPEQYLDDVATLGRLLDNPARAEEIIAFFQARLDRIAAAVSGLSDADKPSVLLVRYSAEGDTGRLEVPPAAWLQTRLVEIAGGAPVWQDAAADDWTAVTTEQVAQWNPDRIFVVAYQENAAAVVQELIQDPAWQALDAVGNNHVYGFPADFFTWDSPDPRWILGVTWLARTIHPDLFTEVDMFQEIHDFFRVIYGLDAQTVELNVFPELTGDWQ